MSGQAPPAIQEWLDKYPEGKHTDLVYVDKAQLLTGLEADKSDFLILDLRREDFKGGKIRGALNIPAQSIYSSVSDLYDIAEASGKKTVYIHCRSSRHRAERTWTWFEDIAAAKHYSVKPVILRGGILDWVAGGSEYTKHMDEYDASAF